MHMQQHASSSGQAFVPPSNHQSMPGAYAMQQPAMNMHGQHGSPAQQRVLGMVTPFMLLCHTGLSRDRLVQPATVSNSRVGLLSACITSF